MGAKSGDSGPFSTRRAQEGNQDSGCAAGDARTLRPRGATVLLEQNKDSTWVQLESDSSDHSAADLSAYVFQAYIFFFF